MSNGEQTIVKVDWYTRACLTAITVLLTVLVIGLWADLSTPASQGAPPPAGYKDETSKDAVYEGRWGTSSASGKQAAIQTETNNKLDELIKMFKNGDARVKVVSLPEQNAGDSTNVPAARK